MLWIYDLMQDLQSIFNLNPLSASVSLIETSQLICTANQLTDFYTRATLALNGLSQVTLTLSYTVSNKFHQGKIFSNWPKCV